MAAVRKAGPPMPSGSFSLGGTWTWPSFARLEPDNAPVTSFAAAGGGGAAAGTCGISTDAVPAGVVTVTGAVLFCDCRPIGVGDVIDGVTCSGVAGRLSTGGGAWGAGALDVFS